MIVVWTLLSQQVRMPAKVCKMGICCSFSCRHIGFVFEKLVIDGTISTVCTLHRSISQISTFLRTLIHSRLVAGASLLSKDPFLAQTIGLLMVVMADGSLLKRQIKLPGAVIMLNLYNSLSILFLIVGCPKDLRLLSSS